MQAPPVCAGPCPVYHAHSRLEGMSAEPGATVGPRGRLRLQERVMDSTAIHPPEWQGWLLVRWGGGGTGLTGAEPRAD